MAHNEIENNDIGKINGQELSEHIKERAQESSNEEELKIGFAVLLDPFLRAWNIKPAYERYAGGIRCVVSGVRKDAMWWKLWKSSFTSSLSYI